MFTVRVFGKNNLGEQYESVFCGREYTKRDNSITLVHENGGSTSFELSEHGQIKDIFVENSHGKTIDRIN